MPIAEARVTFDASSGHDHDGSNSKLLNASPAKGAVGEMAAAGTATANSLGASAKYTPIDHVHALGVHDHSAADKGGDIAAGAFAAGAIATADIADDAVTADKIADSSISAGKLADSAVTSAKIGNGAVTTAKLGADAVDGTKIGDDVIDSEHYVAGSIDTEHLAADCVTAAKIGDDVIDSEHYAAGSIDGEHIANDAIDSQHYAAGSIDNEHLADGAVDTDELAADCIDGTRIADDAVDSEHYAAGSIDNEHLADSAVDTDELADGAVTNAKIDAAAAIANTKLANPNAYFQLTLFVPSLGAGVAIGTEQAGVQMPFAATLAEVSVYATAKAGAANPTVDVYEGAASVLSAPITLAAANTCYVDAPADAAIADNAKITVRATTNAGDGSVTNLTVVLTFKVAHAA